MRGEQFVERDRLRRIKRFGHGWQVAAAMNPAALGQIAVVGVGVAIEHQRNGHAKLGLAVGEFAPPFGTDLSPDGPILVVRHARVGQINQDCQTCLGFPWLEYPFGQSNQLIATQFFHHDELPCPKK